MEKKIGTLNPHNYRIFFENSGKASKKGNVILREYLREILKKITLNFEYCINLFRFDCDYCW